MVICKSLWVFVLILLMDNVASFSIPIGFKCGKSSTYFEHTKLYHHHHHEFEICCEERRDILHKTAASIIGIVTAVPQTTNAETNSVSSESEGNYDCLLDLPQITTGCVRVYLCRHGQTENNRLKLVQGARVDPSINENGKEQAVRLGKAISKVSSTTNIGAVVHSNLRRARETAEVVVSTVQSQSTSDQSKLKINGAISSLGEVDFGALDGVDVKTFRNEIRVAFASWAIGDIDYTAGEGGESGREILERAAKAVNEMGRMASDTSSTSMVAISHSTYLRILLSLVDDSPLAKSVLWKINNCCVNVIDINVEGRRRVVTSRSGLFGGEVIGRLRKDNGLELDMPECHLIVRNECRHLEGMNV